MDTDSAAQVEREIVSVLRVIDAETLAFMPLACRSPLISETLNMAAGSTTDAATARLLVAKCGALAILEAYSMRTQPHEAPALWKWNAILDGIAQRGNEIGQQGVFGLREFQMGVMSSADHVLEVGAKSPDRAPDLLAFYVLGGLAQGAQPEHTGANFALAAMMDDLGVFDLFNS